MTARLPVLGLLLLAQVSLAWAEEEAVPRGEELYNTVCWTCHGRYGRGDGPAAEHLSARPPDFTNPAVLAGRSDDMVLATIRPQDAGPEVPHTPMLLGLAIREESLRDAIAYIRTLAVPGEHVSVKAGKDIYESFCWVCHGTQGDGHGPAAKNLVDAKPRDFTSKEFVIEGNEQKIYRSIALGAAKAFHGSSYMLEWGTSLSPQQIRDVIAYLKTFKKSQR